MCPTQVLKLKKDKKKRCANIEKDINDNKTDSFTDINDKTDSFTKLIP